MRSRRCRQTFTLQNFHLKSLVALHCLSDQNKFLGVFSNLRLYMYLGCEVLVLFCFSFKVKNICLNASDNNPTVPRIIWLALSRA